MARHGRSRNGEDLKLEMSDRPCVKCGAAAMYMTNVKELGSLPKSGSFMGMSAVVSEQVVMRRTLCVSCGHLESYVADPQFLSRVPSLEAWTKC